MGSHNSNQNICACTYSKIQFQGVIFILVKYVLGHTINVSFLNLCLLFISMDNHWSVSTKVSYSEGQDLPSPPLHCQKSMLSPVTLREIEIFWAITSAVAPVRIPEPHAQTESKETIESLG